MIKYVHVYIYIYTQYIWGVGALWTGVPTMDTALRPGANSLPGQFLHGRRQGRGDEQQFTFVIENCSRFNGKA